MIPINLFKVVISSSLALLLMSTGCQSLKTITPETPIKANMIPNTLEKQAISIQQALASGNYDAIVNDIHPELGVRLSMYAHVDPSKDKVFSRKQFAQYIQQSNIRFTWGELDGVGGNLVTTLPDYLQSWVDSSKLSNAKISVNKFQASGNSINNLKQVYQNSDFVEFYYGGKEEYSNLDWLSLRLVFNEYKGKRYLIAIISDRSTV